MTREELERAVSAELVGWDTVRRTGRAGAADAVIRLVVEACCAKADECQGGFTSLAAALRRTFLPTTEPTDG